MNEHEIYDYDDTLVITNTRRKQLEEEALAHHGILGMKWGIRRYQNEDGSLTELGQRHYDMLERKQELEYDRRNRKEEADVERARLRYQRETDKQNLSNQKKADKDKYWLQRDQRVDDFVNNERERKHARKQFVTALAVGAVAVGGGIALHHYLKKKGQEAINSPKLTDAITAGSEKVEDIMKGAPLTFGSKSNKLSFANKYDFGNTANRGNNTKSTFTFGEMLLDDVKKDIKSKKGFSIDHDDAERLRDFASSAPFREAQRGIANRRAKTIAQNIAAHEKAKKLDNAVNDTVTRIGSGRFGNPTAMMPSQKWTTPSWGNANNPNRYTKTAVSNLAGNLISPKSSSSPLSFSANSILGGRTSNSTSTVNPADLLARKAAYDASVNNLGSNLDKTLKKFKHSNIGDAYDMIDSKLMHTAMAISSRRRAQLENRDDYLMHYGRKGMKWGEDIYAEDELKKRQISGQSQYAQQLQAEAARRKYGGQEQHYDTGRGAQVREQQRKQREAQAKYGGTEQYYDTGRGAQVREQQRKQREAKAIEEQRKRRDATINVMGKQVNTSDIEKYKNSPPVQAVEAQARDIENAKRKQSATLAKEYPKTAATVAATDSAITKAFESDNSDRIQRDLEKTANISDTDSVFDAVENSDEYDKLFRDHTNEKKSTGSDDITGRDIALGLFTKTSPRTAHNVNKAADAVVDAGGKSYETKYNNRELSDKNDTAKDAYIKSQAKKRMHDDIDTKYQNGELDQTYTVGGQKVKIHPSEEDITRLKKNADERVDKDYDDYKVIKQWRQRENHTTDSKIMHTAIAISNRRRAQLEANDDYLMHYGRKGMKWGEDIFAEDELNKRQSGSQSQYAQQLKAEAYKRKYGNTSATTNDDAARANGAAIRARQKAIREAQAKYGGGSNSDYANQQMAKQAEESRRAAQNKAASEKYGNKYGSVGQGSSYVNGQISNQQKKTAENMEYASSIERTTDRYINDYMSRNKNAQLYKSMAVDTAMNDAERLGNAELSNIMSGKNELASKQRNTRDNLENAMKNEIKKNIHDDIDAHSDGLTPAQIAQMKGKADIAIDKKFDQIHTRYSSNGLSLTNENVKSAHEKSAEELGRNYAMSTGGLHDISEYKPLLTVDDDAVETAGVKGEEVAPKAEASAPKAEASAPKAEASAPKAEASAPKAEGAPKKMTAKQNHIQSNGLRDHGSFTNNNIDITAESIYDAGNSRNVQKIEEMQGLIEDRYKDVLNLQQNPRFNNKYGSKIQQELDNLMHDYGWLERRKRLAARYAEDYAFID